MNAETAEAITTGLAAQLGYPTEPLDHEPDGSELYYRERCHRCGEPVPDDLCQDCYSEMQAEFVVAGDDHDLPF